MSQIPLYYAVVDENLLHLGEPSCCCSTRLPLLLAAEARQPRRGIPVPRHGFGDTWLPEPGRSSSPWLPQQLLVTVLKVYCRSSVDAASWRREEDCKAAP